jgi:hypothetical protein
VGCGVHSCAGGQLGLRALVGHLEKRNINKCVKKGTGRRTWYPGPYPSRSSSPSITFSCMVPVPSVGG